MSVAQRKVVAVAIVLSLFCCAVRGVAADAKKPSPDDQYKKLTPDSEAQPNVPKGRLEKFTWDKSKVFPGTTREVTVYVPAQYDAAKPAAVFVCQDGVLYQAPIVFDNLIARKEMPVTIGISQFGSWPEANKAMAKALQEKGYDHKFAFGEGVHSGAHGTQIFPDVMRWMWRD